MTTLNRFLRRPEDGRVKDATRREWEESLNPTSREGRRRDSDSPLTQCTAVVLRSLPRRFSAMDGQDLIWKNLYENMMNVDGRYVVSNSRTGAALGSGLLDSIDSPPLHADTEFLSEKLQIKLSIERAVSIDYFYGGIDRCRIK